MNTRPTRSRARRRRILILLTLGAVGWLVGVRQGSKELAVVENHGEPKSNAMEEAQVEETQTLAWLEAAEGAGRAWDDELWAIVDRPEEADAIEARVAAPAHEFHYVVADSGLLEGKQSIFTGTHPGTLVLPLPDGRRLDVVLSGVQTSGPGRYLSSGMVDGVPGSRVMIAYVRGQLSASVEGVAPGEIKVRTIATENGRVMQLYVVDPNLVANCTAGEVAPPIQQAERVHAVLPRVPQADEILQSGDARIDLLMVYTSAVKQALGGVDNVLAEIDLALSKTNSDFANSGITARIRLADAMEVDYAGDELPNAASGWQSTMLSRISGITDGFMDEVHARRDEVGADLVAVVQKRGDPSSSGIAYVLNEMGDYVEPYYSFAVVNFASFSDSLLLSHELGHNLGCAHGRDEAFKANASPSAGYHGAFEHSYGFRTTGVTTEGVTQQIRSIMAYAPGTRVPYFSSPSTMITTYQSGGTTQTFAQPVGLGIAEGEGVDSADNVRTIERTAFQVAGYRLSQNASIAGKLTNVSTRAFVGSGFQTLTGGFVVAGPGNKRLLIRAPGPSIGAVPFNVPGALVDSLLRVNKIGDGLAGENDNWGQPASNGITVASAGQQVGAFTFGNGSLDAGIVLDLAPGSYTAEVTGANGAEGIALIEAYEVDGDSTARVVNLSTRAFASSETPIIAGFVVRAAAGKAGVPKKMFIRVRGPSLANYGLPGDTIMPDPTIEIYDANAQLVYFNDDWDSPSADLDGAGRNALPILKRGEVDQLSEELVFAAAQAVGVADMMPTEPGVVIEMPPGLYTVIVRPFEALPLQPAESGVAIVEVYEMFN